MGVMRHCLPETGWGGSSGPEIEATDPPPPARPPAALFCHITGLRNIHIV